MKPLFFFGLILTLHVSYSQRIEVIDHGEAFLNLKEMTYYDFKDNCDGYFDCLNGGRGKIEGILWAHRAYQDYACSQFPSILSSRSYDLYSKYSDELSKLGSEFERNYRYMSECSKKTYDYIQLHLQKFDIISEYYKDIYNYNLDKNSQTQELQKNSSEIESTYSVKKDELSNRMENDPELTELKTKKQKSISDIESDFDSRLNTVIGERDSKIDQLEIANYAANKEKILKEYEPKLASIKGEKQKAIQSADLYWTDKIESRKVSLSEEIKIELEKLNAEEVQTKLQQREELKSENGLQMSREQIEERYEQAINGVNEEIKKLTGR